MLIQELLRELSIPYREYGEHHHVTEDYIGIDCPYCSPRSGRFLMGIRKNTGSVNCWVCGSFRLYTVLYEITGSSKFKPLFKDLDLDRSGQKKIQGKIKLPYGVGDLLTAHKKYLTERGLSPQKLVKTWDLKGIGIASHLGWHILIPISYQGRIVSWIARRISDQGRRYTVARPEEEEVHHKTILLGQNHCKNAILVTEGPFDAMKIGPGGCCTFGVGYTREQVLQISRYPVRTICFDSEKEAQKKKQGSYVCYYKSFQERPIV